MSPLPTATTRLYTIADPSTSLWSICGETLGTSSFSSIAAYAASVVTLNPQITDWTGGQFQVGLVIGLPA